MANDKQAENLNASVAGEVNLCNIRYKESVPVTFFRDDENWDGNYMFTVYNSPKKNTSNELPSAVQTSGMDMILTVEPETQNIEVGKHYYEIYNTVSKRVEFLGVLEIEN